MEAHVWDAKSLIQSARKQRAKEVTSGALWVPVLAAVHNTYLLGTLVSTVAELASAIGYIYIYIYIL
jgi:hypothetical protein